MARIYIAGPTASGKSALALALAARTPATIINADSMQVYRDLRVLTARPSHADEVLAPHRLYGQVDGGADWSVAQWLDAAKAEIQAAERAGRLAVLVGGTGLYFKALTEGLAEVPAIPAAVREAVRALAGEGAQKLYQALEAEDPAMAAKLRPSDTQRLARALEVIRGTGQSLARFQAGAASHGLAPDAALVLEPPRDVRRARIAARFPEMLAQGALGEVEALLARGLDPDRPVMRAIGVGALGEYLAGRLGLEAAGQRIVTETQRYAKRQATWFRHQMLSWERSSEQSLERLSDKIFAFLVGKELTP